MRDIKFRGKRTDGCGWAYGFLIIQNGRGVDGSADAPIVQIIEKGSFYTVDPETVGEFTGLHDSEGVEIYEGDRISFTVFDCFDNDKQYEGVVVYCGSRFMIWKSVDDECFGNDGGFDLDWVLNQDCELKIINTIHDTEPVTNCDQKGV